MNARRVAAIHRQLAELHRELADEFERDAPEAANDAAANEAAQKPTPAKRRTKAEIHEAASRALQRAGVYTRGSWR